jgi:AcrR family transcriptional regulator
MPRAVKARKAVRPQERRAPRQERAQATVEAILAGALRVLSDVGFEGITTNGIAAASGVSIGSLYQYFNNKDEILVALIDKQCTRITDILTHGLQGFAAAPLEELVRGVTRAVLLAHRSEDAFFRVLRQQLPRTHRFCRLYEVTDQMASMLTFTLGARRHELRIADPQRAAFLIVNGVDGIVEASMRRDLSDGEYEALLQEIGDLVMLYVCGRATQAAEPLL